MCNGTISEIKNCETHFMGFAIFYREKINDLCNFIGYLTYVLPQRVQLKVPRYSVS